MQVIDEPVLRGMTKRLQLTPLLTDARIALLYRADEPLRFLSTLYSSDDDMSPYLHLTRVTSGTPELP